MSVYELRHRIVYRHVGFNGPKYIYGPRRRRLSYSFYLRGLSVHRYTRARLQHFSLYRYSREPRPSLQAYRTRLYMRARIDSRFLRNLKFFYIAALVYNFRNNWHVRIYLNARRIITRRRRLSFRSPYAILLYTENTNAPIRELVVQACTVLVKKRQRAFRTLRIKTF